MKIPALLNPENPVSMRRRSSKVKRRARKGQRRSSIEYRPDATVCPQSKSRLPKEAPKFERGLPIGEVNYPAHETSNEQISEQLKKFRVFPPYGIGDYPRHIPYSSKKREFQSKTGRDGFEVFHYVFSAPGQDKQDKQWVVMWDYNVGLVRITPFFKALGYAKTMPWKVICMNGQLMDVSHSITGGSLIAQGYWLPFEAAKHIAAAFCWEIRYALVPIFGEDFLDLCVEQEDPAYMRFNISRDIVDRCLEEHRTMRDSARSCSALKGKGAAPPASQVVAAAQPVKVARARSMRIRSAKKILPDATDSDTATADEHDASVMASPVDRTPIPRSTAQHNLLGVTKSCTATPASNAFNVRGIFSEDDGDTISTRTTPPVSMQSTPTIAASNLCRLRNHSLDDPTMRPVPATRHGAAALQRATTSSVSRAREKKRKVGLFGADEARAAYLLLEMSLTNDTAGHRDRNMVMDTS